MHRRDHEVELREDAVGVIERAVGEDVALGTCQHGDPGMPRLDRADPLDVSDQLVGSEAAGHACRGAVVGDGHVLVAAAFRRLHQLLDRVVAVACLGVAVKVTANVRELEQSRQLPGERRFDLSRVLETADTPVMPVTDGWLSKRRPS